MNPQIEQAIHAFTQGEAITLTSIIGGTTDNVIVQFSWQDTSYVLRQLSSSRKRHDLLCSRVAAKQHIAPAIHYDDGCVLIIDFVKGDKLSLQDYDQRLDTICQTLKTCHEVEVANAPQAPSVFARIEQDILAIQFSDWLDVFEIQGAYEDLKQQLQQPFATGFIHNDPHRGNFIKTSDKWWLIDWEFAGVGDVYYDLAEVAVYLPLERHHEVLLAYWQREPTEAEQQMLFHHWLARLLMFAAWALGKAKFNPASEKLAITEADGDVLSLIEGLVLGQCCLGTREDFIAFACECLKAFIMAKRF
tara:strand:- start:99250 stop:100161 length:912 start_codon:yes stop_codon:yes gene_type:complete